MLLVHKLTVSKYFSSIDIFFYYLYFSYFVLLDSASNHYSFYQASALKQNSKNSRPILFFQGEEDDFVPVSMMEVCYKAATGPKDYMIVPVAKHAQCCDVNPELYCKKVSDFLEDHLRWDSNETLVVLPEEDEDEEA